MLYIYKFTNKVNGKAYIGQTNNIEKRKRGHKSESFNKKANGYKLPFHNAIRKYGWDNFSFEIIEEINDDFGRDYLNEREKYFIELFNSTTDKNGYNITVGGDGCSKKPLTFSQRCQCSKILSEEQIKDIQDMLIQGFQYFEIKKKYPILSDSFLQNINNGWNFIRDDLSYPLSTFHCRFSKETQENIIKKLKEGKTYKSIGKKYGISCSYLSQINNGKRWRKENEIYPLFNKNESGAWSKECKYDIIFSDFTYEQLSKKYHKSYNEIKAIAQGRNRRDKRLIYPLRKNKEQNKEIWSTLF